MKCKKCGCTIRLTGGDTIHKSEDDQYLTRYTKCHNSECKAMNVIEYSKAVVIHAYKE